MGKVLNELVEIYDLRKKGKRCYNFLNNYPICFREEKKVIAMSVSYSCRDLELLEAVNYRISQDDVKENFDISYSHFSKINIMIYFIKNSEVLNNIEQFIIWFTDLLESNEIHGISNCCICNEELIEGNGIAKIYNDTFLVIHHSCAEKLKNEIKEENKGGLFKGIIGAAIGGIISSIPWVIGYALGFFSSYLGFLIALGTKYGYEKFGGKIGIKKIIIITTVVLLSVITTQIVGLYLIVNPFLSLTNDLSIISKVQEVIKYFIEDKELFKNFAMDIILGISFAFLGLSNVVKQANHEINKLEDA